MLERRGTTPEEAMSRTISTVIITGPFLGDSTQELVSFTDHAMAEKYAEAVMEMRGNSAVVVQNTLLGEAQG